MTNDTDIVRLHFPHGRDGDVWVARGLDVPKRYADAAAYVEALQNHYTDQKLLHIRMLGVSENVGWITYLYDQQTVGANIKIELASPLICNEAAERNQSAIVLYRMRQCLLAPSLGGWQTVTDKVIGSYQLADLVVNHADTMTHDELDAMLTAHPAWCDLAFISGLHRFHVALLIAHVLDPRWFVNLRRPERLSNVKTYLGLHPSTVKNVMGGVIANNRERRCSDVIMAWRSSLADSAQPGFDPREPGAFLWRRYNSAGAGWRGVLRASQAFVVFFMRTWQHALFARTTGSDFFIPNALLRGNEVAAYLKHRGTCNEQAVAP